MKLWLAFVLLVAVVDNCHSQGCVFDNKPYSEEDQLRRFCTKFVCENEKWKFEGFIHSECASCHVQNDPHFTTFDNPGTHYDWHGQCEYSITQAGRTDDPPFSVYGEFSSCIDFDGASCLYVTTFKNGKHSSITFERPRFAVAHDAEFDVYFNGDDFDPPLTSVPQLYGVDFGIDDTFFAWRGDFNPTPTNPNCVSIVGTKGLMIQYCGWDMRIWADKSLKRSLYGLCGHNDGNPATDFTDRNDKVVSKAAFAKSWEVDVCINRRQSVTKCEDPTSFDEYRQVCADNIGDLDMMESDRDITIESCAFDRCIIIASGSTDPSPDDWLSQSKKSAERTVLVRSIEKDITDPTATAAIEAPTPTPKQPTTMLPTLPPTTVLPTLPPTTVLPTLPPTTVLPTQPPTTVLPTLPPTSTTTKLTTQAATHLPTLKPSPSDLSKQNVIVQVVQRVGP